VTPDGANDPPRNGEVAAAHAADGRAGDSAAMPLESDRPLHRPTDGPPPRSGEDEGRIRHRTLGASAEHVKRARHLRQNLSLPEALLWRELKGQNPKFRRQFPIAGYVADFACARSRLIVEVDGIAHEMGNRPARDDRRTKAVERLGWKVVRISAKRVLDDPNAAADALLRFAASKQLED